MHAHNNFAGPERVWIIEVLDNRGCTVVHNTIRDIIPPPHAIHRSKRALCVIETSRSDWSTCSPELLEQEHKYSNKVTVEYHGRMCPVMNDVCVRVCVCV